jgi:RNase P/RNase MRP subunit p29
VGRRTSTRVFCAALLAALVAAFLGGSAAAVSFSISPGGSPVTVTISTSGATGTATFTGTKDQRVSLSLTGSTIPQYKVTLVKVSGPTVFTVSATKTAKFVDTNTLPSNGTYKLTVDPNSTYTGKVTLQLYNVPADASAAATFGGAPGTVATTIPGQNAYVTFDGVAGHRVALKLSGVTVTAGNVTVLDPNGGVLAPQRAFARAESFIDPIDLALPGIYKVVLDPKSKYTGSVTVTAYDVPADTSAALTLGTQAVGTISVPGQRAKFTFSGTAGQRISVNVESSDVIGSISLLNGLSSLASTNVSLAGGFLDTVTLPADGTYTVVIDPTGDQTGAVTFAAYNVPNDQTQAITAGGPPVTATTTVPGQNAYLTFTATAGQRITVLVENVIDLNPAELDLQKADGTHVIPAPLTVTSSGAWMQTITLAAGNYRIMLDPQQAANGSADVSLFTVPPDLSGTIALNTTKPVTTTAPGQNATYTFNGTAGTRLSLNLTAVSIESVKVSVLKPDGSNLIVKTVGTSGGFGEPVKLLVGGKYKVVVDPQSSFYGDVTVGVYVVPANTTGTLVLGTPLTFSTSVPGENATRTFNGTAGQRISFNFTGVTMASVKVIVKAPGTSPPTVLQHTFETDDFVDPVTLPRTGVYTVTIDPQGASTGSVTLTFYNVPADATGSTSCANTVPGQNCKLTLTVNSGTRTVTVTTNVPAAAGQTQSVSLTIYQGTTTTPANQVAFGTAGPAGNDFEVFFPANSTYTIVVDQFGSATGTTSVAIS